MESVGAAILKDKWFVLSVSKYTLQRKQILLGKCFDSLQSLSGISSESRIGLLPLCNTEPWTGKPTFFRLSHFEKIHKSYSLSRSSIQAWFSVSLICDKKKLSGLGKFSFRMWQFFYRNPLPAWRMFLSAQLLYGVSFELKISLMPLCKLNCEWEKPAIIAFGSLTLTFQKPNLLGKCYWSAFFVWLE